MHRNGRIFVYGLAAVVACGAAPLEAQYRERGEEAPGAPTLLNIHLQGADAVGEFGELVGGAFGGSLGVRVPVTRQGGLGVLLEGGLLVYGYDRDRVCMAVPVGCFIQLDLTTSNNLFYLAAGPELSGTGRLAPYVNGTVGLSYFSTSTGVSGSSDVDDFASTEHFGDLALSTGVGGGVRIRVGGGSWRPVYLDLGARYFRNGRVEYLTEGDIVQNPDGSLDLYTNRSQANLLSFRLGVSIAMRRDRDDGYDRRRRRRR